MSAPETLARFLQAFGAEDFDTVREVMAENMVFHFPGKSLLAGEYEGREAVIAMLQRVRELAEIKELKPHGLFGDEDHAVVLLERTLERNGETGTFRAAQVYHVAGGKVTEGWIHEGDQYAFDAFFS